MTEQLIDFRYIFAVILAFAVTALSGPLMIPVLRRLKVGNTERKELQSHQKKTGTPTMGGLMFLLAIIVTSLFFIPDYPKIVPILFVTVAFGVIGFFDDYLKVVLKRSDGLLAFRIFRSPCSCRFQEAGMRILDFLHCQLCFWQ